MTTSTEIFMAEDDHPREECGVAAVYALKRGLPDNSRDISHLLPLMLQDMQNRGELSAGITTYDRSRAQLLRTYKALGTVTKAFTPEYHNSHDIAAALRGSAGIGHVRYATCGKDDVNYAQPFERIHGRISKWFSFCFNGNIANQAELRRVLTEEKGYHLNLESDTEVFMHFLAGEIAESEPDAPNYRQIFANLSKILDGAWCLALIDACGNLIIARDPQGFKPMSYAIADDMLYVASESVAIWNRGVSNIKTLEPGTVLICGDKGIKIERFAESPVISHCFFEWIYFSNVASEIDNRNVYEARVRAGQILARYEDLAIDDDTIVVSVPDTAKACGDAMRFALKAPVVEGLFRNRYVGRSFIKSGDSRGKIVQQKFTPLPSVLKGKKVLLVEDSIVRGTTLKHIIRDIRQRGEAKEIHLRIACPPILSPCFYGIDKSTLGELFARHYIDVDRLEPDLPEEVLLRMAHSLGADSLRYLPAKDLPEVIGLPGKDLCMACVDSKYPTEHGRKLIETARAMARDGKAGRTY